MLNFDLDFDERGLPSYCFVVEPLSNEVVVVHRDVKGYSSTREGNQPWYGQEVADAANADRGITRGQAEAMMIGSMFGWDAKGANPAMYDENGKKRR